MEVSRTKRMAAGYVLLQAWAAMESYRVLTGSHVRRELKEGVTRKELKYLEDTLTEMKELQERIRKLGWRLQKSA